MKIGTRVSFYCCCSSFWERNKGMFVCLCERSSKEGNGCRCRKGRVAQANSWNKWKGTQSSMQFSLPDGYLPPALPVLFALVLLFIQDIILLKACAGFSLFFCDIILLPGWNWLIRRLKAVFYMAQFESSIQNTKLTSVSWFVLLATSMGELKSTLFYF